jgi:hypothetical protein
MSFWTLCHFNFVEKPLYVFNELRAFALLWTPQRLQRFWFIRQVCRQFFERHLVSDGAQKPFLFCNQLSE